MRDNSSGSSLLMAVASRLPLLVEQAEELDAMLHKMRDAQGQGHIEEDVCRRVERWAESAAAGLDAAEKLIASEPARALAEAAIQLMLAVSKSQLVGVSGMSEEERAATAADLERLLQSALPIVADAAGVDLSDFARSYYADRRTDPFYRGSAPMPSPAGAEAEARPQYDPMARLKAAGFGS